MSSAQYPTSKSIAPAHAQLLTDKAIDLQVAQEAGIWSCLTQSDLPSEFSHLNGQGHPAIVFPWRDVTGNITHQLRPIKPMPPTKKGDKERKYLWPKGKSLVLGVHPRMAQAVMDPTIPLFLGEGTKQGLAAVSVLQGTGYAVASLTGCWGWKQQQNGVSTVIDCLDKIPWQGRDVIICFDADLATNLNVHNAGRHLSTELMVTQGAKSVKFIQDFGTGTEGLDDVLGKISPAKRQGFLLRLIQNADKLPRPPRNYFARNQFLSQTFAEHCLRDIDMALADNREDIVVYRDGYFRNGRELAMYCRQQLGNDDNEARYNEIKRKLLLLLTEQELIIPDRSPHLLINVRNGMLDPVTLNLLPHDPTYRSTFQFDIEWDENATCPTYDQWIVDQAGSQVDDLEETAAQMLDPTHRPTLIPWLFGPTRSGKSTFSDLLKALVGSGGYSSVGLHELCDKFIAAELYGKTLNVGADLPANEVFSVSVLKILVGEDCITAGKKYQPNFQFHNTAMFVFTANTVPPVNGDSSAYLSKIKPFRFDNSYLGSEDPKVKTALLAELPGIFRRLVLALQRRIKRDKPLPTAPDVKAEFEQGTDRVLRWVAEECVEVEHDEDGTGGETLHKRFKTWTRLADEGDLGRNKFYQRLDHWRIKTRTGVARESKSAYFRLNLRGTDAGGGSPTVSDSKVSAPDQPDGSCGTSSSRSSSSSSSSSKSNKGGEEGRLASEKTAKVPETKPEQAKGRGGSPVETDARVPCAAVSVDFETADADTLYRRPKDHPNGQFLRLLAYDDGSGPQTTSDPAVMSRVLEDAGQLVTHNGWAFDLAAAAYWLGLDYRTLMAKTRDLRVEATLGRPPSVTTGQNRDRYDLDHLGSRHCGFGKSDGLAKLKRQYKSYDLIPVDHPDYIAYAKQDIAVTNAVADALPPVDPHYLARERRVATIAGLMSLKGVPVDVALVHHRLNERNRTRESLLAQLSQFGFPDSKKPWSTKAGKQILLDLADARGNDEPWPTTDKGALSVAGEVFEALSQLDDELGQVARLIIALSAPHPFLEQVAKNLVGDRVHPQYRIINATGRWSSSEPNVMGVGKRTDYLLHDRDLIVADTPDEVLISVDLSGIDTRCVAGLCGDPEYALLFEPGVDIHREIAEMFFSNPEMRTPAKAISHGINYGRGPRAVAIQTGRPFLEVSELFNLYFDRFPGIADWHEEIRAAAGNGEPLAVGSGRYVRTDPDHAYTEAPGRLAQAAARDLAMDGLLRLEDCGLLPYLRLFVHDEVILSVPKDDADKFSRMTAEALSFPWESPSGLVIPVIAEPGKGSGYRWSDCYKS